MDNIMLRSYKYRLYPTKAQRALLARVLAVCRELYNAALEQRRVAWKRQRVSINYSQQAAELPGIKEDMPELKTVYSQVLQDVLRRIDKSFKNFFRRLEQRDGKAGYPRFKSKNRYHSFTYPQYGRGCKLLPGRGKKGLLRLSGIGDIKIRLHRPLPEGTIKTVAIKREVDQWYACFTVEMLEPELAAAKRAIGIDSGFKRERIFTLSDGRFVANPAFYRKAEKRLARAQRSLSRKKKGSHNREKQRIRLAKIHRKIARQRRDFLHKESRMIVNQYDLIKIENLNLREMLRNNRFLAKPLHDTGLGIFVRMLAYKAADAGKQLEWIDAAGTTEECSRCGMPVAKSAGAKYHRCPWCDLVMDQHLNAAMNILGRDGPLWRGGTTRPVEAGSLPP
jgi:putative transposase